MKSIDYLESEFAKVLVDNKVLGRQTPEYLLREWDKIRVKAREMDRPGFVELHIIDDSGGKENLTGVVLKRTDDGLVTIQIGR